MIRFKKTTALLFSGLLAFFIFTVPALAIEDENIAQQQTLVKPELIYSAHVADLGWMNPVTTGNLAGTTGQGKQMEALRIDCAGLPEDSGIEFQAHCRNEGWQGYRTAGEAAGTTGRGLSLQAVQIRLTGSAQQIYDVYYRMHVANYGWLDWASNDDIAGTTGLDCPAEAIEIQILLKGSPAPGSTEKPYLNKWTAAFGD